MIKAEEVAYRIHAWLDNVQAEAGIVDFVEKLSGVGHSKIGFLRAALLSHIHCIWGVSRSVAEVLLAVWIIQQTEEGSEVDVHNS